MAVATKYYGTTFEVASLDSNWNFPSETHICSAKGVRIHSIWFRPTGKNDVCIIRDGSATGPIMFEARAITASGFDNDLKHYYYGAIKQPYIQQSDLVLTASASARVIFDLGGFRS